MKNIKFLTILTLKINIKTHSKCFWNWFLEFLVVLRSYSRLYIYKVLQSCYSGA